MSRQRKDEHLKLARILPQNEHSDFDYVHLIHQSLTNCNLADIDLSSTFCNVKFPTPLYINAMTGGSQNGKILNQKLSIIARELNLPMALGSASITLKDSTTIDSFKIARSENPNGFLIANLGAEHPLENILQVIEELEADAIQLHLNVMQELLMPEGSRSFSHWTDNLANIAQKVPVPIIIKEVGFGMSKETMLQLKELGFKTIDISGSGGTNFAAIENNRNNNLRTIFNDWGLSTTISLLESQNLQSDIDILASGGINNPLQAIKSLIIGAKGVGLAGFLLHELDKNPVDIVIKHLQEFIDNLKITMVALNAQNIQQLQQCPVVLEEPLINWCQQRKISLTHIQNRTIK